MTCTNCYALFIKQHADVLCMNAVNYKRHNTHPHCGCTSKEASTWVSSDGRLNALRACELVRFEGHTVLTLQPHYGSCKSDRTLHVWCTCLEPKWWKLICTAFPLYVVDHCSTTLIWWHALEHFSTATQNTDPSGSVKLMSRPDNEVTSKASHIDGVVYHRLRRVHDRERANIAGKCADLLYRLRSTKCIRYVYDRYDCCCTVNELSRAGE